MFDAHTLSRRVVMVVLMSSWALLSSTAPPVQAQAPSPLETVRPQPDGRTVAWAIAIHGGAGGDPATWPEEKRQARRDGLDAALRIGRDVLAAGGTALDAVEASIRSMEDNAVFNAGRGAVLTEAGKAELDASIMDGRSRSCGAIAGVTTVKNPISTARLVMTDTRHVLLAGPGADAFAASKQVQLVDPGYFLSQREPHRDAGDQNEQPHFGTVGCVALDSLGNLAAGTSTGGTAQKLPGRVGDSPIVGAGTFADNRSCAVSGTGIGEEFIRNSVAYDLAAQMDYAQRSLESAVTDIMTRRLRRDVGGLISISHRGEIVMQHNTPAMSCAAADSNGRFETFLQLENGGRSEPVAVDDESVHSEEQAAAARDEGEVRRLIDQQARDWNSGDLDRFMQTYWNSDQLTFTSAGQITRGWQPTMDRYKSRYPDRAAMGVVTFTDVECLRLDAAAMQVLGVWRLQRDAEPIGGRFTLVFRKFPEGWRIVHDHTSVQSSN